MVKKQLNIKQLGPTVLVILDGFGLANPKNPGNAITPQTAPYIFSCLDKYPHSTLKTWGKHVGFFPHQQGNSEAGHMNIGAGRIVKQDLVQISDAIADGTFFKNEAFKQAVYHLKKYKTDAHILALLTNKETCVHAYPEHLYALLKFFREEGIHKVFLHLITDGRDSSPHSAPDFLQELRIKMKNQEKIATIMGRFYAMDRNRIWSRTQEAYEAMVLGKGCIAESAEEALTQSYNREEIDEFICPTVIVEKKKPVGLVKDNDAIFFTNARSDRARQITKVFVQKDFQKKNPGSFSRAKFPQNTRFVAMSDFGPDLDNVMTAFPSVDLQGTLPMVLKNKKQLYIAESEKYAHVTYFINGGYADPVNGEIRVKIPSPKIDHYDKEPEMSAPEITDEVVRYISKNNADFICVNFANADMIGHTGNIVAAKKAIRIVDKCVKRIVEAVLQKHGQLLITADHGNAEEMYDLKTGEMMTRHSLNPVPCILIRSNFKGLKFKNGILADVAPTLLKMMSVKKPKEMTGKALF